MNSYYGDSINNEENEDEYDFEDINDEENFGNINIPIELIQMVDINRQNIVLTTWNYNWQTKESKIPDAMVMVGKAIDDIKESLLIVKEIYQKILRIPKDLKPEELLNLEKAAIMCLKNTNKIDKKLETQINASKIYWFPENEKQLELGGYRSVRQSTENVYLSIEEIQSLSCVVCQELLCLQIPVIFKRRCTLNPLLKRCCDEDSCSCSTPRICLTCALDHILRNCIHEGKSSVRCPACRGEVCIYDIQEIIFIKPTILKDQTQLDELETLRSFYQKHKGKNE